MFRNLLIAAGTALVLALLFLWNQGAGILGFCFAVAIFCPLKLSPQPLRVRVVRREEAEAFLRRRDWH